MTQSQKDFLALSHGQEWVTFYESFDKLVQDNLSRSSELLRRAMALPEVADREVQQIRSEMEEKLANEKARQRAMLASLQEDLSGSYRQVSMLARSVGSVIGDLERLSQRVNEAIVAFDADEVAAEAPPVASSSVVQPNGSAGGHAAPAATAMPEPEPVSEPVEQMAEEPAAVSGADSVEDVEDAPVSFSVDEIAAAVEEQNAMLEAAEQKLDDLEAAIDLSALADAETEAPASASEPVEVGAGASEAQAADSSEQRPRPHWLSVTRSGSR